MTSPINVKVIADRVIVTYEDVLSQVGGNPYGGSQFSLRGLPSSVELVSAYWELGQLELLLSTPIDDLGLSTAGIVYKPGVVNHLQFVSPTEGGSTIPLAAHFIPLSTAEVTCASGDCPPEAINGTDVVFTPLRISRISCAPNSITFTFSEFLSPGDIPATDAFTLKAEPDPLQVISSVEIAGRELTLSYTSEVAAILTKDSILQYEPPSENFLRTVENPFRIVRPFSIRLGACDEGGANGDECLEDRLTHVNGMGIPSTVRKGECANVDDYVVMYGIDEAKQVSNLGNPNAPDINFERMEFMLDEASMMLDNYIKIATWAGKAMLLGTFKISQLIIARYLLHSTRRPKDVLDDYTRLITWIEVSVASNALKPSDCDGAPFGNGRVLAGGLGQQYNVNNGMGLQGWMRIFPNEELFRIQNGGLLPDWVKQRASVLGYLDSGNRSNAG